MAAREDSTRGCRTASSAWPLPPSSSGPERSVAADQAAQFGAATLLAVESKVRAAKDETELLHLIVNELRKLVAGRQCILVRASTQGKLEVACISSLVP